MKPPALTTKLPSSAKKAQGREIRDRREQRPMIAELYRRAEAQLRKQHKDEKAKSGDPKLEADPKRLFHELQVHQVELEMQNIELQKSRDELELALENFTDLYDFAPVGYFTLTADSSIQQANFTGASLVGIDRSRLVGRCFGELFTAGLRPAFHAFLKQVFAGQARQRCDFELLVRGQPPRVVSIEARRSPGGNVCRAAMVDITDRKQVEDKVQHSEVRYRRLFEAAHDGVLLLDPGTRKITDANPFMTKLLGYPHYQLVGKELFEIGLLKDEVASQEMFRKLKRKHQVRYEDLPLENNEGRHQEVEVVANLYQENGSPVIQCNIRDITERKRAEHALRTSEELHRLLFHLGPVAVYACDRSGVILKFNQRAAELWGRKPVSGENDRFCGSFKLFRSNGSAMRHANCPMAEVLSGKIAEARDKEVIIERPNASRLTCVVNIRALKNERGEITGAINCFYDITERKRADAVQRRLDVLAASNLKLEKEIVRRQAVELSLKRSEQHQRLLLRRSHAMQEQLRNLSHQILSVQEEERKKISRELHDEIAQSLAGINVLLGNLKAEAGVNGRGFQHQINRTQRLVEKSVDIVHRFARDLRPTLLDDLGLIPALHAFVKTFTQDTGVRVQVTVFAAIEKLDNARRTVLYRVAQEALTNVARHAQASTVELNIEKLADKVRMTIQDNGQCPPMDPMRKAQRGKRLGLIGMRERLEMVGGSFEIQCVKGKGTTVRAEVPFGKVPGGGSIPDRVRPG
jgi:PAS domain S-box-containing protein